MCGTLTINDAEYTVIKLLGKGKGGYSYLVTDGTAQYVLKQIHHEPCEYYAFGDKLQAELSVLCMKDSWRAGIPDKDKTELVTTCIYRFSRNPAFLGFDLMYVGILLLYGNLLTLGFSVFAIVMLHLQILQEERYLVNAFGAPYQEYCRHVFRYLGRK